MRDRVAELQGLRAAAALAVVAFHFLPGAAPGGFTGVDVFFVLSGFLVTRMVLDEISEPGGFSFARFWVRRTRRLAPAALAVGAVCLAAGLTLLPPSRMENVALEAAAAAVHLHNWLLWAEAADYFADAGHSPFRHYWSLSVEEQAYLALSAAALFAVSASSGHRKAARAFLFAVLAFTATASAVSAALMTASDPAQAYFATDARAWEFAAGGLLAFLPSLPRAAGKPAAMTGLFLIAAGIAAAAPGQHFPWPLALLPVAGTVLFIAGTVHAGAAVPLLSSRPATWLGDRSYPVYLWHWPVAVFHGTWFGTPGPAEAAGLVLLTVALAWLTHAFVETPFRKRRDDSLRPLVLAAAAAAAFACAFVATERYVKSQVAAMADFDAARHPGPAAFGTPHPRVHGAPVPTPAAIRYDLPQTYGSDCHHHYAGTEPVACVLGDPASPTTVVLAGDSHSAQWIAPFAAAARARGWRLLVFTKSACPLVMAVTTRSGRAYPECSEWKEGVFTRIAEIGPDFVFFGMARYPDTEPDEMARGMEAAFDAVRTAGGEPVMIAQTPMLPFSAPECVWLRGEEACAVPLEEALDGVTAAGTARAAGVRVLDMNDMVCENGRCAAAAGGMMVWRDDAHLTPTWARALTPWFADRVSELIEGP